MTRAAAKASNPFAEAVYRLVRMIPRGQVASYSQVGTYLGSPGMARAVGNALRDLGPLAKDVPWHRVIKADGTLAPRGDVRRMPKQQKLLAAEGVKPDKRGRIPFELFGWAGPPAAVLKQLLEQPTRPRGPLGKTEQSNPERKRPDQSSM